MKNSRSNPHRFWQARIALLISIGIIVPLGYWVRFAQANELAWLHDAFGGVADAFGSVAYEIFWILLVLVCFPQVSIAKVAVAVCLATCALEVWQLWQAPFLQALRSTLPGRLVLGNTFTWMDFPAYAVGSFLGYLWGSFVLLHQRSN